MLLAILCIVFILGLWYLISIQRARKILSKKPRKTSYMPTTFVPIEAHIVPTHASQTNKMNNMIGNVNSSQGVGPGMLEVVIPSDYYSPKRLPSEYSGPYWPSGSILPDYIY